MGRRLGLLTSRIKIGRRSFHCAWPPQARQAETALWDADESTERYQGGRIVTGLLGGVIAGVGWAALAARRENMSLSLFVTRTVLSFAPSVFKDPERLRQQLQGRPYPQDAP